MIATRRQWIRIRLLAYTYSKGNDLIKLLSAEKNIKSFIDGATNVLGTIRRRSIDK